MPRSLWVLLIAVVTVTAGVAPVVAVGTGGQTNPAAVAGPDAPASHQSGVEVSIQDIQEPEGEGTASPYDGETVTTSGVVTSVRSDGAGYFIQNGTGEYSGVYVYTGGTVDVSVGDHVRITAPVTEYFGLTELDASGEATVEVLGQVSVPEPTVLDTGEVSQEAYEGVLVAVEGAAATSLPDSNGEWGVDDGSGTLTIAGATAGDSETPGFVGEEFERIVGPLTYSFGAFKVLPQTVESTFDGTVLTVLAYTDIGSEAAGDGTMGRFITLINQRRDAASGPTVVVGNGDEISPHALRGAVDPGWMPPIRALNIIDPAAEAVQNHELDYDEAAKTGDFSIFEAASEASEFPWLQANVENNGENIPGAEDSVLVERGDLTVGILSVADSAIDGKAGNVLSNNGYTVKDYTAVAKDEAAALEEQGADVIIALTPIGNDLVRELARNTENIDVFVTGDRDSSFAPEQVGGAIVTHPPGGAQGVAEITLPIEDGEILGGGGDIREVSEGLTRNATWADYIDDVRAEAGLDEVVAETEIALSTKPDEYTNETALGNAITQGILEYTDADAAVTNSGGIRGYATFYPLVTKSNIRSTLSFGNDLVTLRVTGAELRDILASQIAVHQVPYGPSHAIQVAGVRMEWVPHSESEIPYDDEGFGRISELYIDGEPVDPDETYVLATNRYIAEGGSGFPMDRSQWIKRYDVTMAQAVISWLEDIDTVREEQVAPAIQKRLRMVDRFAEPTSVEDTAETVTVTASVPEAVESVPGEVTLRNFSAGSVEATDVSLDTEAKELSVTFDRGDWEQTVQPDVGGEIYVEYYDTEYTSTIRNRTEFQYAVLNIDVGAFEGRPGAVLGYDSAPQDPDNDGIYEDVTGDGEVTSADALAMLELVSEPLTQAQVEAFDADGDGAVDFGDVIQVALEAAS